MQKKIIIIGLLAALSIVMLFSISQPQTKENFEKEKITFSVNGRIYAVKKQRIVDNSGNIDQTKLEQILIKTIPEIDDSRKVVARFYDWGLAEKEGIGFTTDYPSLAMSIEKSLPGEQIPIELLPKSPYEENTDILPQEIILASLEDDPILVETAEEADKRTQYIARSEIKFYMQFDEKGIQRQSWRLKIDNQAAWFEQEKIGEKISINLNKEKLREFLETKVLPEVHSELSNAVIKEVPQQGSGYAKVEGLARDAYHIPIDEAIEVIQDNIARDNFHIYIPVEREFAKVINKSGVDLGEMVQIGYGRSNFVGSPAGRAFNIKKGLEEHYNNYLIAPGDEFNYNDLLGGPVTYSRGWKPSLAIFGPDLVEVPGGGLCQVSTTMFRAALDAGVEILEKSSHTKYVHYYEDFGVGMDAAIYPGSKNLRFRNNTGNYILIQAFAQGNHAVVRFFGTPDGRQVEMEGQYYWDNIPEGRTNNGVPFSRNEILWIQKIIWPDGRIEKNQIVSSYKNYVPKR